MQECSYLMHMADFLFEAGMLRKTPRTGYQFLGSGGESVAEHSFRTAVIGYVLANMAKADIARTVLMCLFHDFHEARIGDFNYVNHIYNASTPRKAMEHALEGTGLQKDILSLWDELEEEKTVEAMLANDADHLDLILSLKEEEDMGNPYASKWLGNAIKRLCTKEGQDLARAVMNRDHTAWWALEQEDAWWQHRGKTEKLRPKPSCGTTS